MDTGRVSVLLAVTAPRLRLRIMAALRDRYSLTPLGPGEDPLRAARSLRPKLVLLAVPRSHSAATLHACRAIKTDAGTTPLVALVDVDARLSHPSSAVEAASADGYLGMNLDDADLLAFVQAVLDGERPVRASPDRPRGLLDRLLRR
ncbi:MAG: response regulator transcription factor [Oligoflexia bacterium]|nr:response regulator transcription factor [Oligoflexia bacterium]